MGEPDQTWYHPIWELVKVPIMLVMTAILWDSLLSALNWEDPPPPNRRTRRLKKRRTMHIFPATWMVLTGCIMLWKSAMIGMQATYHPLDVVTDAETYHTMKRQLKRTYQRVEAIDDMVDISPSTFIQYQRMRLTEVHDLIKTKVYESKEDGDNNEPHGFSDAHEEVPTTMKDIVWAPLFDTTNGCTII